MPNREPLSRGGITGRTGVPNDVLTYWLRYSLVLPIDAPDGTGRHLRFNWYEANIAAVMNQLRQLGVNIEGLLSVAAIYREAIAWADRYGLDRDDVTALWQTFICHSFHQRGEYDDDELAASLALWSEERHGATRITPRIEAIRAAMPKDEFYRHLDAYLTITEQPKATDRPTASHAGEVTFFWRVGDTYRFAWGEGGPDQARADGALATIAVDVSSVLAGVWNRPEDAA